MKLRIDAARCAGHGVCYSEFPELFADDEAGYGTVAGEGLVGAHEADTVRLALIRCPERAISLDD